MTGEARSINLQATPDDWRVFALQDLATLERGKFSARPRNDPRYFGGAHPFIQTGDVTNSQGTVTSYSQTLNEAGLRVSRLFPPNTLFFTIAANIGDVAVVPFATACPDSLIAITPNRRADRSWLFYALGSRKRIFESLATQNAQLNINLEKLRPYELAVPPVPEQKAIAAALSDMDALLGALDRLIAKKRDVKQAAMQQLLTARTRLPGFSGKWETKRIGELTDCTSGGTPSTAVSNYWGGAIRWMSSGELNLRFVNEVKGRITEAGLLSSSAKMIPSGCVLIGLAGQGKTRGTVAINRVELCTNQSIAALLPCSALVPEYLYYNLNSRYDELRKLSAGDVGRGGLNLTLIRSLRLPVPELGEQAAVAEALLDMDAEITALEQRLDKTRLLKQGMMQELLTGRTRLL